MSVLTTLKYKRYANKIISTGDDYQKASNSFLENIDKTIPKNFAGKTASKAAEIAQEIASALYKAGTNIENIGYGVRRIVDNNDID